LIAATDANGGGRLAVNIGRETTFEGEPVVFFPRIWTESFKYAPGLAGWLDSNAASFDCVHVHAVFSHSSIAAGRASRTAHVPYVLRPLGSFDSWALRRKRVRKALLWRLGVRDLVRGAAAIHCTTDDERRLAEANLGPLRAVVIPAGLEDVDIGPRLSDGERAGDRYIVTLSRLHPVKGLELLIESFLEIAGDDRQREWRLLIVGDGEASYVSRLRALAGRHPEGDRVVFKGWLTGTAKIGVLRGASLFALPSHQESFGLSALEALACGVPVVLTEGVNLAPAVRAADAGWVVPREKAALMAALRDGMTSPAARSDRGERGRVLSERYRWPHVAERLADLYTSIANPGRASKTTEGLGN
jgi:glycosyltransferase involved in cell wall biosynthesis